MDFTQENLFETLNTSNQETINQANFGAIKLTDTGNVEFYNRYQSSLSGLSPQETLGKNFFVQVAPCTNNFMVAERFHDAVANNTALDETLDYIFTYKLKPTKVTLRLLRQQQQSWICVDA